MKSIFAAVRPVLAELGYRRSGSTFVRMAEPDRLGHVVNFQRGGFIQEVPGELDVAPGPHGGFTVNLGVWLPGVRQFLRVSAEEGAGTGAAITAASCEVSARLGQVMPVPCDYWWPVSAGVGAGEVVAGALAGYGLPWLGRFGSWDQVLREFEEGPADGFENLGPGVRLLAMGMRLADGEHEEAEQDFARHLEYLAAQPVDRRILAQGHSRAWFIESLDRLAVAHHFAVDVQAYAAKVRHREQAV